MKHNELFEKLLNTYKESYDIYTGYRVGDQEYDAYAFLDVTSSRYVLMKKAELWRADCYEHVFFKHASQITGKEISAFSDLTKKEIEPKLVRKGEHTMPKDHMYSFITGIFICDGPVTGETVDKLKRTGFYKNYSLSLRGYCQLRLALIDIEGRKVFGNKAARDMVRDMRKMLRSS